MRDSRDETEDAGRQSVRTSARVRTDSMAFSPSPESASTVRPYRPEDEPGVRELIDADRLPGQPHCTPEKLAAARRGPTSLAGWAGPTRPQISVLADVEDRAHGVIAYLSWTDVKTGVICWVHAHENPPALRALLGHALAALAHCPQIEAFVGAPPGPSGRAACPVPVAAPLMTLCCGLASPAAARAATCTSCYPSSPRPRSWSPTFSPATSLRVTD